jgi:membrane protein YqaA with SNARE-associated domain
LNESVGLGALFLSSFLAATLLPGGSELVFAGVLASGAVSPLSYRGSLAHRSQATHNEPTLVLP